jgi:UDP-N-acetyl-D-glucosamine dehydrogenase
VVTGVAFAAARDLVLVATDHDIVDYGRVARTAQLSVDTRNIFARHGFGGPQILKA